MQLEDEVNEVAQKHSIREVRLLDLMAFRALHDSCQRLEVMRRIEALNVSRASQFTNESFREEVETCHDRLHELGLSINASGGGVGDLIKDIGMGF